MKSKQTRRRRYRLDCYVNGEPDCGKHSLHAQNGRAHFASPGAAIDDWLSTGWGYETPAWDQVDEDWDAAQALLGEAGFIVDRKTKRVVLVVTYRWPDLGESRLPVATVLDVASGTTRTVRVEDCERDAA